jgi:phospholipase C
MVQRRWRTAILCALVVLLAGGLGVGPGAAPSPQAGAVPIDHIIVLFMENRSFDNLFGRFPGADGVEHAAAALPQADKAGTVYPTLPQPIDNNDWEHPVADTRFPADLPNRMFDLSPYAPPDQVTGDPVHEYYAQQYQINGGRMDRMVAWSGVGGLAMGYYDLPQSHLWRWAREYTLADQFHHASFGGSMLAAFWLICACTPYWPNPPADYVSRPFPDDPDHLKDNVTRPDGYVVNDAQPLMPPYQADTPESHRVPLQTAPHIGDRLDAAGVSWVWYAQGWNDAIAGHPSPLFAYHHQAFNYFANVGADPVAKSLHEKDEDDFLAALRTGTLPQVAWVKPTDGYSQHPGLDSVTAGDAWVEQMLQAIRESPQWSRTAVIVTYDENGGLYDHVAPPVVDEWGPGLRVPAVIVSPYAKRGYVDHTPYDTTSILKFVEWRWNLPPVATRDAGAANLLNAFDFTQPPPRVPKSD